MSIVCRRGRELISTIEAPSLPQRLPPYHAKGGRNPTQAAWGDDGNLSPNEDRSHDSRRRAAGRGRGGSAPRRPGDHLRRHPGPACPDRKSTRLNSSHEWISYAVFCLKKKK